MPDATPLSTRIRELAADRPDAPAVSDGDTVRTRAEIDASTNRLARAFAERGVRQGDLVSIGLPNGVRHLETSVAVWKLGAVPQPVSHRLPPDELAAVLEVADPSLVYGLRPPHPAGSAGDRPRKPADRPWVPGDLDTDGYPSDPLPELVGPSWKAPTSGGSTGRPKVIVAGQRACTEEVLARADGLRIDRDGVMLCTAPLHHNAPYMFSLMALLQGHHVVIEKRFDAQRTLDLVERHRVTWLYVVPTMMSRILRLPDPGASDLSSLRTVLHVGAPCPPDVKRGWLDLAGPDVVVELYSGTESQAGTFIDGREWLAHPGSVGRVTRGEMSVRDEDFAELPAGETGEIWMRTSDGVATYHYLGATPEERDGWETLGDMGHFDADGYLHLADRRTDMILVGGANVYPAEIEGVLDAHPDVRGSAVIGLPDNDYGQVVHAIVHASPSIEDALREHVAARLTPYKTPRTYEFVDSPLRDDAGKVRRSALRDERVPR
ncbi:AMP-binding protein [Pseudonocardia endophytica]|uniref:AMP-binding protein n=1 Tax=Pseudonocardia endophytica TaxID=401976 RepID=UPI001FB2391E|nr:AMP-binding protein [Pseudonocardia endophytica]